jgi:hypothetical protein
MKGGRCKPEYVARPIFDIPHPAPERFAPADVVIRTKCQGRFEIRPKGGGKLDQFLG